MLNAEYFKRIDALNYTMLHDDGQHVDDLEQADVVLVGVSRTSKTPTSIYLANRGVKTANIPLVPGVPVPPNLETLTQPLVVGLTASPERIVQIRQNRLLGLRAEHEADQYVDKQAVAAEIAAARKLCAQAQLADHRRDAALDRRDRRRSDGAAGRAPPAVAGVSERVAERHAAVACRETPDARLEKRGAARGAGGGRHSDRDRARRYRRARHRSAGRASQDAGMVAALLAREKAKAVSAKHPDRMVLGADQTLALGQRRFSKAPNRAVAREQLAALRGKTHTLHSAVAVMRGGAALFEHVDAAHLTMRTFSDAFLDSYLDAVGDTALASVGGYQLEGTGIQLFERVEGDHFTVLGLPLLPLLDWLRHAGLLAK